MSELYMVIHTHKHGSSYLLVKSTREVFDEDVVDHLEDFSEEEGETIDIIKIREEDAIDLG